MRLIRDTEKHLAIRAAACIVVAFLPIAAQAAAALSKPVLGYVFDPGAKAIRPIAGVPGAAVLDEPLPNASKMENAFLSPTGDFAIAESLGDENISVIRWNIVATTSAAVDGALRGVTLAAFSPGGFAAVYNKDAAQLQVWRGLPSSPVVVRGTEAAGVRALAISDDGTLVASCGDAGVTLHSEAGARLVSSGTFSSLAFLPGTRDLLAAEPGLDRIVRIVDDGLTEFAGAAQGLAAPQALAVSRSGKYVAVAAGHSTIILDAASGAAAGSVACDCSFTAASTLKGDAVFLLTAADGAQWVLDLEGAEARLVLAGGKQ